MLVACGLMAHGQVATSYTVTTIAGSGPVGFNEGRTRGDGGLATSARLESPYALKFGANGQLYMATVAAVRKLETNGIIQSDINVAFPLAKLANGRLLFGAGFGGLREVDANGNILDSSIKLPTRLPTLSFRDVRSIAVDQKGDLYIRTVGTPGPFLVLENGDDRYRQINAGTTFDGVATDQGGNIYLYGDGIYQMQSSVVGGVTIRTFNKLTQRYCDFNSCGFNPNFGGFPPGVEGFKSIDGAAGVARVGDIRSLVFDRAGNAYFTEELNANNRRSCKVRVMATDRSIRTLAGGESCGFSGETGSGSQFLLDSPNGIEIDSANAIYVADSLNHRVRKLTPSTVLAPQGSHFVPIAPCRAVDTRLTSPSSIPGNSSRNLNFTNCNIPATATAVALNITLVPSGPFGFLSVWPAGQTQPVVSTMNSLDGRIKANAAIVGLGTAGQVSIYVTDTANVILDVNGYFVPAGTAGALAFYPVAPCRVVDTRQPFAGGIIGALDVRRVSGGCLPSTAQAYSLNVTVVPPGPLGFLTLWPDGTVQPTVSTLNNLTGTVVANAAILRAGTGGAFNAFVTDSSHLIVDLNGYFAAPGSPGALSFYPTAPCRIFDTRNPSGAFGGPIFAADATRNFVVPSSGCGIPGTAQAFVSNATVVPSGVFGFLTLWQSGTSRPTVSTLNAIDGSLTSNAAIVTAGTNGTISVYTSSSGHLLLDISGYFAP
jgi:hypothetical protein